MSGRASFLLHHYQEVITHCAYERPAGHAAVDSPQPLVQPGMSFARPRQIRRGREYTQALMVHEREVLLECAIKFPGSVIARPDGVFVHRHWHEVTGETDFYPFPTALPRVVHDFPGTVAPDDCKDQPAARLQQPRTFARQAIEIRDAIERTEIGVGAVVRTFAFQALKVLPSDGDCLNSIRQALSCGSITGSKHHLRRPIRRCYMMSQPRHANGVEAGAASDVDQTTGAAERSVQSLPHFGPHFLDEHVVTARTVVVGGNTVERILGVAQLRHRHCRFL
jgi:hypothetical protein